MEAKKLLKVVELAHTAAHKFINKVESWLAHSKETYRDMKEIAEAIKESWFLEEEEIFPPLKIFRVDCWEIERIVARDINEVKEFVARESEGWFVDASHIKEIRDPSIAFYRQTIGDQDQLSEVLSQHESIEIKRDHINWWLCVYKKSFAELLGEIKNNKNFKPEIVCSTAF